MNTIKLVKKETGKVKSNFGHTANEWGKPEKIPKNIIYAYDLKWNVDRNDDESLEESMKDCSFCSKCFENSFIPKLT